jgi:hypothetical protein
MVLITKYLIYAEMGVPGVSAERYNRQSSEGVPLSSDLIEVTPAQLAFIGFTPSYDQGRFLVFTYPGIGLAELRGQCSFLALLVWLPPLLVSEAHVLLIMPDQIKRMSKIHRKKPLREALCFHTMRKYICVSAFANILRANTFI